MANEDGDGDNMDAVALIHRVLEELGRGDVNAARTRGGAWSYPWKGKTWRGGQGGKSLCGRRRSGKTSVVLFETFWKKWGKRCR
jgi:hypothetical protein